MNEETPKETPQEQLPPPPSEITTDYQQTKATPKETGDSESDDKAEIGGSECQADPHLPDPKFTYKIFEVGDEESLVAYNEKVAALADELSFKLACAEHAMISAANRSYIALQAMLEALRTSPEPDSKTITQLPMHYDRTMRQGIDIYARFQDESRNTVDITRTRPIACMVIEPENNNYGPMDVVSYLESKKDEILKINEKFHDTVGYFYGTASIDVLIPGCSDTFIRIIMRSKYNERRNDLPYEVRRLEKDYFPIYTTEEQVKYINEFEAAHPEITSRSVKTNMLPVPTNDKLSENESLWKRNNVRDQGTGLYDGKYLFKAGVIKLRVMSELREGPNWFAKWCDEYSKFVEGIAHKFDMQIIDNICDEEFVIPSKLLTDENLVKILCLPTYKYLPGAKLVFIIHGESNSFIIFNHKKMLTANADFVPRGVTGDEKGVV